MLSPDRECAHSSNEPLLATKSVFRRSTSVLYINILACLICQWFQLCHEGTDPTYFPQSYLYDQFIHRHNRNSTTSSKVRKNILFILPLSLFHFFIPFFICFSFLNNSRTRAPRLSSSYLILTFYCSICIITGQ